MSDFSREELIEYLKVFNPKNYADAFYENSSDEQLQEMYNKLIDAQKMG